MDEGRLGLLERRVEGLVLRLDALEADVQPPPAAAPYAPRAQAPVSYPQPQAEPYPQPQPPPYPQPQPQPQAQAQAYQQPARAERAGAFDRTPRHAGAGSVPTLPRLSKPSAASLEDLLGGRVLAWVGGAAVLLGIVFLLAIAVSNGWIGEGARTLLAGAFCTGLLALGVWLHERKSRVEAALAAVATGVAGLLVTVTVASQVYELLATPVAVGLALAIGAVGTALAVRWDSKLIGSLGLIGGLLAPVLGDAHADVGSMSILIVAGAAAVGVLLWRRWEWLSVGVFAVTVPQWGAWLVDSPAPLPVVVVLSAFGLLGLGASVGYELRVPTARLRPSSFLLLSLNALVIGLAGWFALAGNGHETLGKVWLLGLALCHLAIGLAGGRTDRISHELGLLCLAVGVLCADVAFALIADGLVLSAGFAAGSVAFAVLLRKAREKQDTGAAGAALGLHVALALSTTLAGEASPKLLVEDGFAGFTALAAVGALAAACFASGRIAAGGRPELGAALDSLGLVAVAFLTALALDGAVLVGALCLQAVALARVAHRTHDPVALFGAPAFLMLALGHVLAFEAPPGALVDGLEDPLPAALALAAVSAAALACGWLLGPRLAHAKAVLTVTGAVGLLFGISALLVTPFQPGGDVPEADLLDLGVRQQGQVLLSALWATVGFVGVVIGLRRGSRPIRVAALSLLLVTVAKVFLYDLSTLTSVYRVVSFVALGLLLLLAAFVWQRMRPPAMPDLRDAPSGVR